MKSGTLQKKGLGWMYKPWTTREFTFDPSTRVLSYRADGRERGAVKVQEGSKAAKPISSELADGHAFAFEVFCFKMESPQGEAESERRR